MTAAAGSTAEELIAACGGMADGHTLKAYLPGGASGGILPASKADIPLDFGVARWQKKAVRITCRAKLFDQDNIWQAALNLMRFLHMKAAGNAPCRSGTQKAAEMMAGPAPDTELLGELAEAMADASICGLAKAAPNLLVSAMTHFLQDISPEQAGE